MKALITALALAFAGPVAAQQNCGTMEQFAAIVTKHKEQLITSARIEDGVALVTYANMNTGTWTTAIISVEGVACIAASGKGFRHYLGKGA